MHEGAALERGRLGGAGRCVALHAGVGLRHDELDRARELGRERLLGRGVE